MCFWPTWKLRHFLFSLIKKNGEKLYFIEEVRDYIFWYAEMRS